jgi:hypothetical protein
MHDHFLSSSILLIDSDHTVRDMLDEQFSTSKLDVCTSSQESHHIVA